MLISLRSITGKKLTIKKESVQDISEIEATSTGYLINKPSKYFNRKLDKIHGKVGKSSTAYATRA